MANCLKKTFLSILGKISAPLAEKNITFVRIFFNLQFDIFIQ